MPPKSKTDDDGETKIKKPSTAYFCFLNERRSKFREENPEMTMCNITKALTEVWKKLTDEERKKYD